MFPPRGPGSGSSSSPAAASRSQGCGPVETSTVTSIRTTPARGRYVAVACVRSPNARTSSPSGPAIIVCVSSPARWTMQSPRPTERGELPPPLDDRQEVVPCQRPRLAREARLAVREEDLGLADAARIEEDLAGARVARGVLEADAEVELAEGNPRRLAAPPR